MKQVGESSSLFQPANLLESEIIQATDPFDAIDASASSLRIVEWDDTKIKRRYSLESEIIQAIDEWEDTDTKWRLSNSSNDSTCLKQVGENSSLFQPANSLESEIIPASDPFDTIDASTSSSRIVEWEDTKIKRRIANSSNDSNTNSNTVPSSPGAFAVPQSRRSFLENFRNGVRSGVRRMDSFWNTNTYVNIPATNVNIVGVASSLKVDDYHRDTLKPVEEEESLTDSPKSGEEDSTDRIDYPNPIDPVDPFGPLPVIQVSANVISPEWTKCNTLENTAEKTASSPPRASLVIRNGRSFVRTVRNSVLYGVRRMDSLWPTN